MAQGINQFTIPKTDFQESSDLSYLLGVLKGDASLYRTTSRKNKDKNDYILQLAATDEDFVSSFNKILKKIFFREAKVIEYTLGKSHFYKIVLRVREFYGWYISKTEDELYQIAEKFPNYFIKGIFDSEGSCTLFKSAKKDKIYFYPIIRIINSDLRLLEIIQRWLKEYYNIHSKISKRLANETLIEGRKCRFKKDVYCLGIYNQDGVETFFKVIGTSIKRKMQEVKQNGRR